MGILNHTIEVSDFRGMKVEQIIASVHNRRVSKKLIFLAFPESGSVFYKVVSPDDESGYLTVEEAVAAYNKI